MRPFERLTTNERQSNRYRAFDQPNWLSILCAYVIELLADVLEGGIKPGVLFDRNIHLNEVPEG
jgi:hypothetical protein